MEVVGIRPLMIIPTKNINPPAMPCIIRRCINLFSSFTKTNTILPLAYLYDKVEVIGWIRGRETEYVRVEKK